MSSTIYARTIVRGYTYSICVTCKVDGSAENMTGKTLKARFTKRGATSPAFTRSSATAAHFTWTSQATGEGHWDWDSDETIANGEYRVEIYKEDTSSPVDRKLYGITHYVFRLPETGSY